jgi:hypothetical protein
MKQVTIFQVIRDTNDHSKIIGKQALRIVNVHPTFEGIGEKGAINKAEFKKLADVLEPHNDGYDIA